MAETKTHMRYRIVNGFNPKTKGRILRPQIAERETYYLDQVVQFALDNGYVRGQFHDMRGALNGFIEAIQYLGLSGKAVSLNDWLRVHAELTGTVGDDYQISSANEVRVCIQALKELKTTYDKFSWENVSDTGVMPKVQYISYEGAEDTGKIMKSKTIAVTGKNLVYKAELGDAIVAKWMEGDTEKSATLTPATSGFTFINIAWPSAFDDIPADTEVTFTFTLHGGKEGGAAFAPSKSATVIAA